LEYAGQNAAKLMSAYGNISMASVGAIQRGLIGLEHDGVDKFFGEPALNIDDLLQMAGPNGGDGVINILAADKLMQAPKTYSTFLLWLLNRLFEVLPEVGDLEKPKLVFFFDEAHLLFNDTPSALREKIEQVVRLIRSKGVGVYFISQSPSDLPDSVLGQLGNRIQHALRAYTPKDQKALKAAAASFRANPSFNTETAIAELATGEALVSLLDAKGAPAPVERAFILPPQGQLGPLDAAERQTMVQGSLLYRYYAKGQDRETAFEILSERQASTPSDKELAAQKKAEAARLKAEEKARLDAAKVQQKEAAQNRKFWKRMGTSVLAPVARQVLGGLFKRK
ncbi:MAG: DUF853 domain-containing protein, partial [Deltaproteobacteria bacterium]|nr:DUF853 domain-containing protein [Deltaproteobacteria bacterium]